MPQYLKAEIAPDEAGALVVFAVSIRAALVYIAGKDLDATAYQLSTMTDETISVYCNGHVKATYISGRRAINITVVRHLSKSLTVEEFKLTQYMCSQTGQIL